VEEIAEALAEETDGAPRSEEENMEERRS